MVCIPGGPTVIGADDQTPAEKPRHVVEVSTFYIDRREVTNREYEACEKAGACPKRTGYPSSYIAYMAPDRPAIPIQWPMARAYCTWAGKRLPTEAEWEKVARAGMEGRLYPWGDAAPDCSRAAYKGCTPAITRPVGSFAPGPYGVLDLAGNGYEWVNDWASECYEGCAHACGAACQKRDPLGPCDGAPSCEGVKERVLKGGSWYWPPDLMRGSWRRAQKPESGLHRLSVRCASSTNVLTAWPPLAVTDPPPAPPDPLPPSPEELARFRDVIEDDDVMEIKPCRKQGMARLDCRDPMSYVKSNEKIQHVWLPYIKNLGGGYVGLGSDQSYSFIAAARSRWAWIFDYDPAVIYVHKLIHALVSANDTPTAFVDAFELKNVKRTREFIKSAFTNPEEQEAILETYNVSRAVLRYSYSQNIAPKASTQGFGWLRTQESYDFIRTMLREGRIQAIKGNMLTDKTLPSIAKSARALGVTVRIYYPSNAEEQWPLTPQYRANVASLPFDERSVVLRTLISKRFKGESSSYWHYVVQSGFDMQRRVQLEGYQRVWMFMDDRLLTNIPHLSVIRLPSLTTYAKVEAAQ